MAHYDSWMSEQAIRGSAPLYQSPTRANSLTGGPFVHEGVVTRAVNDQDSFKTAFDPR